MASLKPKKCAWVCAVFLGDRYIPGALTLAQSLLELDTEHDLVCMVTPDVSPEARHGLKELYTKVYQVPYITSKNLPPYQTLKAQKMFGPWMPSSFTKWNILDAELFSNYEKVCLLDADMVFIANCDHVFDLPAPAMTFSSAWARPYCRNGGMKNYFVTDTTELEHGDPVPLDLVAKAREDGFVGKGSMVLVEPSTEHFETMLGILAAGMRHTKCSSGFDEQVLADVYLKHQVPMYHIHQRFNWVVSKDSWLIPPGSSATEPTVEPGVYGWYGTQKPWEMNEAEWPDLAVWNATARNVVYFHPNLQVFMEACRKIM